MEVKPKDKAKQRRTRVAEPSTLYAAIDHTQAVGRQHHHDNRNHDDHHQQQQPSLPARKAKKLQYLPAESSGKRNG